MRTRNVLLVILLILVVVAGGFFFYRWYIGNQKSQTAAEKGIEIESVTIGVSPAFTAGIYPDVPADLSTLSFNSQIFDSLVSFDDSNKIIPNLATKWTNPDNLTWRFYLNPAAKFSNGTAVTATDVKFTYDYLQEKNKELAVAFPTFSAVTVVDNNTIDFKTAAPDPVVANKMAYFLILSKAEVDANGTQNGIGSGPYTIVAVSETDIQLTRNTAYWGTLPKVKNVTFKFTKSGDDRIPEVLAGQVDFTSYITVSDANKAKVTSAIAAKTIQKQEVADPSITFLGLNSLDPKSPLNNLKVRQAIYKAFNIKDVITNSPGAGVPATQMVAQSIFGFNPAITRPTLDLAGAKQLMTAAGFPDGFTTTIDYPDSPTGLKYIDPIVAQLKTINITATPNAVKPDDYYTKVFSHDTSMYTMAWSADSLDAAEILENLIHTGTEVLGSYNIGYSNATVDTAIEQINQTLDQSKRKQAMQQAMKLAMDDVTAIPLYQSTVKYIMANDILWTPRLDGTVKVSEMAGKPSTSSK